MAQAKKSTSAEKASDKHRTTRLVLTRDGAEFFEVAVPSGSPLKIEHDKENQTATLNIESVEDDSHLGDPGSVPEGAATQGPTDEEAAAETEAGIAIEEAKEEAAEEKASTRGRRTTASA